MIMTMLPGLGDVAGRHGDVGVDVGDRDGGAGRAARSSAAASAVSPPACSPSGQMSRDILSSTTSARRGSQGREEVARREAVAVLDQIAL